MAIIDAVGRGSTLLSVKLDGNMDNLTTAMELMGQFCASCKKK